MLAIALASLCGLGAVACAPSEASSPNSLTSPEPTPVVGPTRSTPPEPADRPPATPTPTPTAEPESPAFEGPAPVVRTPTTVEVTFGGWRPATASVEVGGYAAVVEEDGTCTLHLAQGGTSVTATSVGLADATTTSCGTLTIAGTELRPGTWTGVLRYESPRTAGESKPISIEVPR